MPVREIKRTTPVKTAPRQVGRFTLPPHALYLHKSIRCTSGFQALTRTPAKIARAPSIATPRPKTTPDHHGNPAPLLPPEGGETTGAGASVRLEEALGADAQPFGRLMGTMVPAEGNFFTIPMVPATAKARVTHG